jgi:hypothetical protein
MKISFQREKRKLTRVLVAWLREETDVSNGSFPPFTDPDFVMSHREEGIGASRITEGHDGANFI